MNWILSSDMDLPRGRKKPENRISTQNIVHKPWLIQPKEEKQQLSREITQKMGSRDLNITISHILRAIQKDSNKVH